MTGSGRVVRYGWFVDKTYVKIAGRWVYLYRAIEQFGQVIDVLVLPEEPVNLRSWLPLTSWP